jgi:hypothetical protein
MLQDAIRLNAHIAALSEASRAYAAACKAEGGTAYGVELRTLALARRNIADRFMARLRELGAEPRHDDHRPGAVDVDALIASPGEGARAVLESEQQLIAELREAVEDSALSPETRQLMLSALPKLRAHARRLETFLDTL